jgi:RNA polymerase sigma-70 factor (ECF subfamily)
MTDRERFFVDLIREYDARLRRICRTYAPDEEGRNDLHQDILVQLWRALPAFEGESSAGTWLYRVALNTALDTLRRRSVRRRAEPREATALTGDEAPSPDERVVRDERIERLYAAIDRLEEIDRALILLHLDERSYREIADVLGMSESNVGVRLHRAKRKLADWLEEAA